MYFYKIYETGNMFTWLRNSSGTSEKTIVSRKWHLERTTATLSIL